MSRITFLLLALLLLGTALLFTLRRLQQLKQIINKSEIHKKPALASPASDYSLFHSTEELVPMPEHSAIDPNDPRMHAAAANEENLYELKIQQVVQFVDGDARQVDPNRFEVFHPDLNQTLDIIVNKQIVKGSLQGGEV